MLFQRHASPTARPRALRNSLTLEWLLMSVVLLGLVFWLSAPQQLSRINAWLFDTASRAYNQPASPDIVLVLADDDGVASIGRWPWRRALHAQLVRQISAGQPKSIGLDFLFTEEDLDYPADDFLLAQALASSRRVVLPVLHNPYSTSNLVTYPIPGLRNYAAGLGHAEVIPDSDGAVRSFYAQKGEATASWPHFALAMLCVDAPDAPACHSSNTTPATPQQERSLISFADGDPPFTSYSYLDVLRGHIPPSVFRNKHVIVGATATGIATPWATPGVANTTSYSPEINAHILSGILQNAHAMAAPAWANHVFNTIPVLLALLALVLCGPSVALLISVLLGIATLLTAFVSMLWWHTVFSPAAALLVLALAYPLWSWRRLNAAARFLNHAMQELQQQGLYALSPSKLPSGDFLQHRIDAVEHASEQLQQLHRFVTETLLQLPSPTLACDKEGRVLLTNSAAHRYAESLGRPLKEMQPIALLLEGALERGTLQPLWDNTHPPSLFTPMQREGIDVAQHSLLLLSQPFTVAGQTGWLVNLVDISDLRQALAQRDEAMHFISHDIRAPIGAILTLIEMDQHFGKTTPSADLIDRIQRYARSSLELADDFVHLVRAQHKHAQRTPVELGRIIDQALDDTWAAAQARFVELDWMPQEAEAWVLGDASMLRRACVNLITNAIKYGPVEGTVYCTLTADGTDWVITIRDEGEGISEKEQARLFAPFSRQQQHERSNIQGIGLGLAYVYAVAAQHGGSISVQSTLGIGSSFMLRLPQAAAPSEAIAVAPETDTPS